MPNSLNSVLIIALLIAPGYITLSIIKRRTSQFQIKSDVEFVVATMAVGMLVQAIAFVVMGKRVIEDYADHSIDNPITLFVWLAAILVVIPIVVAALVSSAITKFGDRLAIVGLDTVTRTSRAWTVAVNRDDSFYVRVWLKDDRGTVVGGKYSTCSFASTNDTYQDLFLEEVWELDEDDWFVEVNPNSAGVWISPDTISRIEFTKERDENDSGL